MNESQIIQRLDQIEELTTELRALLASDRESISVHGQGIWRRDMLEVLWPRVRHLTGVRALFALTAERAPAVVTYSELLQRSGLPDRQQANEHARLSRVARELFGKKVWPLEAWQDSRDGLMHYRMDVTMARWCAEVIDEVRASRSPLPPASRELEADINAYTGRWVAQDGDEILVVGDSPAEVGAELESMGRKGAVWRIPDSRKEADQDLVV